jgi:hypothetical protein
VHARGSTPPAALIAPAFIDVVIAVVFDAYPNGCAIFVLQDAA